MRGTKKRVFLTIFSLFIVFQLVLVVYTSDLINYVGNQIIIGKLPSESQNIVVSCGINGIEEIKDCNGKTCSIYRIPPLLRNVLYVDAGGFLSSSSDSVQIRSMELFFKYTNPFCINYTKSDYLAIMNSGDNKLSHLLISSNLFDGSSNIKTYSIFHGQLSGKAIKIAFFGLTGEERQVGDWKKYPSVSNNITALSQALDQSIKNDNPDVRVLLYCSNSDSLRTDARVFKEMNMSIDVIVAQKTTYNVKQRNTESGYPVCYVGKYAESVGLLRIYRKRERILIDQHTLRLDARFREDQNLKRIIRGDNT